MMSVKNIAIWMVMPLVWACGAEMPGTSGTTIGIESSSIALTMDQVAGYHEESSSIIVTATLDTSAENDLTFLIDAEDLTTQGDFDYTLPSTITFEAGSVSKDIEITLVDDEVAEDIEQFNLSLKSQSGLQPMSNTITVDILASDQVFLFVAAGYNGALGGRSGADNICETDSPLSGSMQYRALISIDPNDTIANSPTQLSFDANYPVQDIDGQLIYVDWDNLLTGQSLVSSNDDMNLGNPLISIYTGSVEGAGNDGGVAPITCNEFSTSASGVFGAAGRFEDDGSINFWYQSGQCNILRSILCIAKPL